MSTACDTLMYATDLFKNSPERKAFYECVVAEVGQGRSLRDAKKAAQQSGMLDGAGVFQRWDSGRIDGAIQTEHGPVAFEHGEICGQGRKDIQSGALPRGKPALEQIDDAIRSATVLRKPLDTIAALVELWRGLEHTRDVLATKLQRAWIHLDSTERTAVLPSLPVGLKERAALPETKTPVTVSARPSDAGHVDYPWLAEAIRLEAMGQGEESLDIVFDKLDDWLLDGHFDRCSSFLSVAPVDQLSTALLLTILTATLPARTALPARSAFFERVQAVIRKRSEDADTLLSGLAG